MQLTFNFNFEYGGDELFCCYTIPYSYHDLQSHINDLRLLSNKTATKFLRFESIGKSIGGLPIPILRISHSHTTTKPVIMIIGRQHSGETYSSFIIHGLINFLCS